MIGFILCLCVYFRLCMYFSEGMRTSSQATCPTIVRSSFRFSLTRCVILVRHCFLLLHFTHRAKTSCTCNSNSAFCRTLCRADLPQNYVIGMHACGVLLTDKYHEQIVPLIGSTGIFIIVADEVSSLGPTKVL